MTADAAEIVRLAERVEQATGPDRELDCLIWAAAQRLSVVWTGADGHLLIIDDGVIGSIDPGVHQRNFTCNRRETGPNSIPAYTASLDAAMSLVPEADWEPYGGAVSPYNVVITTAYNSVGVYPTDGNSTGIHDKRGGQSQARSVPLALTAAALRARAASALSDGKNG